MFKVEPGFIKGDSRNLPNIDVGMLFSFFGKNDKYFQPEMRNVKTSMAARESYGDDAVGYVQVKREGNICYCRCRVCPEHRVKAKAYGVEVVISEETDSILKCECMDCAGSKGGCKHAVAFLMWLHRRSEEPAPTSVLCYWKKPKLAGVGSNIPSISTKELASTRSRPVPSVVASDDFLEEFLAECHNQRLTSVQFARHDPAYHLPLVTTLGMHILMLTHVGLDADSFLNVAREAYSPEAVKAVEEQTRMQNQSPLWHDMRYGRATASIAYSVSRCKTTDGSLVAQILGARTPDTPAMKRGRQLEERVRLAVEKKIGPISTCGLFMCKEAVFLAASPDGLSDLHDAVIEIKCPSKDSTVASYIKEGVVTEKFKAQITIQMMVTGRKEAFFCVADPRFEENGRVDIYHEKYDEELAESLIDAIGVFWKANIFPRL